ncbi:TrkA family potassium uptake protein [Candidatus Woesearchaeota archaeon]|nr:TrkA family potassium uptake protein [Candidatus Woesearchaeota archaeon]
MVKSFAVIGLGRFGSSLATALSKLGYAVLAIDKNEEKIQPIKEYLTHANVGDSTDKEVLKQAGVLSCDVVIVAMGERISASLITTLNLKELGAKYIIAKANHYEQARILEKIGADRIVYPERDSAIRLANQLVSSDILQFIEASPDYMVYEVQAPKEFFDKSLHDLNLRRTHKIVVLAIRRDGTSIIIPETTHSIDKGDELVIIGKTDDLRTFMHAFKLEPRIGTLGHELWHGHVM